MAYQEKPGPKNGFEALRLIVAEYMLKSRQEILHFRSALVNRTFKAASITELIQNLDYEESRYQKLLRNVAYSFESGWTVDSILGL